MNHALVTGGAGFIGSHLVDRLLTEGWRVTVVDNFDPLYPREVKEANLASLRARGWCRVAEVDVRDRRGMESQLEGGYDAIVHLAARVGSRLSVEDPSGFQEVNVCGTQNLLECARHWGVKQFVFASSGHVYGTNPRVPWREDDTELQPPTPFAASKLAGEHLGHVYSHLYSIRFVALRLFSVYGPRQRPDQGIDRFARAIAEGRPVELFGGGSSGRDVTYVGDVVEGIRAAMDYGDLAFEVINLGSGRLVGLYEMVRALEAALGATALLEPKDSRAGDPPRTLAHIGKAQRLLGYHPHTSFEEGLAHLAGWLTGGPTRSLLALDEAVRGAATSPSSVAPPVPSV